MDMAAGSKFVRKRKTPRRLVSVAAFLYTVDGWPLGECQMRDISKGGARLRLTTAEDIPADILLSFSRAGTVRRECTVAWREGDSIGVRFLTSDNR
jgi:PilZ domain-containing protein